MKITIFGARGAVGSRTIKEALDRGHNVTAVIRSEEQKKDLPSGVTIAVADVMQTETLVPILTGQDLAISAVRPAEGSEKLLSPLTQSVMTVAKAAGVRLIAVGGAASLKITPDSDYTVLTAPDFLPASIVPIATACQEQYEAILNSDGVNWTYLCPPAMLMPGERKGTYRTGTDSLVTGAEGNAAISMEDFAVALLDEAEKPAHIKQRFTVGY